MKRSSGSSRHPLPTDADYALSLTPARHPFQLFILVMCVVSGMPTLLGEAPTPDSLEASSPLWFVYAWAATLTVGAIVTLVGMVWTNRFVGVLIEQVGLVAVGSAAVLYGVVVFLRGFEAGAAFPASVIVGFGVSCLWRWKQLQRYVKSVLSLVDGIGGKR